MQTDTELIEYLRTGVAPAKEAGGAPSPNDPILRVLVALKVVEMLGGDLHYRAHGKPFFALHELADLLWRARSEFDDLTEAYYLGERSTVPPTLGTICGLAANICNSVYKTQTPSEDECIGALRASCGKIVLLVEEAKKYPLRSGTNAVLDEVAKHMQIFGGLMERTAS